MFVGTRDVIDSLLRTFALKNEKRSGWLLRAVHNPESVADHSWGTALLCMVYAGEAGVEAARAVQMAIVHDLAEAVTGDVATRVARMHEPEVRAGKAAREQAAMNDLFGGLPDNEVGPIVALWREYEDAATGTAQFVRDMNLIDMCMQALLYEESGCYDDTDSNANFPDYEGMDEFFATSRPRLSSAVGARLFDELLARYSQLDRVSKRGGPHA